MSDNFHTVGNDLMLALDEVLSALDSLEDAELADRIDEFTEFLSELDDPYSERPACCKKEMQLRTAFGQVRQGRDNLAHILRWLKERVPEE